MPNRPQLAALLASPRRLGNSAALLSAFLKPFRSWDVKFFHLPSMKIAPCSSCDRCLRQKSYVCRWHDDTPKLFQILDRVDALVLAAPVFYYGFPAQAKAVIDRCHPLFHDPHWKKHPRRPAYFLANCASSRRSEFKAIVPEARAFLNTLAFEYSGQLLVPGMGNRDAARRLHFAKIRAESLARPLARKGLEF